MSVARRPDGRFPRGVSGNPGGRPHRVTALQSALEQEHDPAKVLPVVEKLRELAMAGDVPAARLYLDRVLGPVRSQPDDAEDLSQHTFEELTAHAATIPEMRGAALDAVLSDPVERERLIQRLALVIDVER